MRVLVRDGGAGAREEGDMKMEVKTRTMRPEDGRKDYKPRQPLETEKGKENRFSPQRLLPIP